VKVANGMGMGIGDADGDENDGPADGDGQSDACQPFGHRTCDVMERGRQDQDARVWQDAGATGKWTSTFGLMTVLK